MKESGEPLPIRWLIEALLPPFKFGYLIQNASRLLHVILQLTIGVAILAIGCAAGAAWNEACWLNFLASAMGSAGIGIYVGMFPTVCKYWRPCACVYK